MLDYSGRAQTALKLLGSEQRMDSSFTKLLLNLVKQKVAQKGAKKRIKRVVLQRSAVSPELNPGQNLEIRYAFDCPHDQLAGVLSSVR